VTCSLDNAAHDSFQVSAQNNGHKRKLPGTRCMPSFYAPNKLIKKPGNKLIGVLIIGAIVPQFYRDTGVKFAH
jgi:hypothetical protein